MKLILLVILYLCTSPLLSQGQSLKWKLTKPSVLGTTTGMVVKDSFLFVSTSNDFARTSDAGETWVGTDNFYLTTGHPLQTLALGLHGGLLFMSIYDSSLVYRSADNGDTWEKASKGLPACDVISFGSIGTTIFAGTTCGGIYKSINNGDTWESANVGIVDSTIPYFGIRNNTILASAGELGIYRSTDLGNTWKLQSTGIMEVNVREITSNQTRFYASCGGVSVLYSDDDGISWQKVNNNFPYFPTAIVLYGQRIIINDRFDGTLYQSTDNGNTWTLEVDGLKNQEVFKFAIIGNTIFAGSVDVIFKSEFPVGIDELRESIHSCILSPQPVSTSFTLSGIEGIAKVRLLNTLGIEVKVWSYGNVFDVSDISNGMYIIQILSATGIVSKPMIISH